MAAENGKGAYTPTERTRFRLRPDRGHYDRALVHSIIDEALVCHVSFILDGRPCILPTSILRIDENVYLHGSPNNRMLRALADGAEAAIAVTHVDAIVAGRSGFGCSVDYRSVIIYSSGDRVDGPEKEGIINRVIQSIVPGHRVRPHKRQELDATLVLRFPLIEVSAKVRDCGNKDFDEDLDLDLWAGTIPLRLKAGPPQDAPFLPAHIQAPAYALNYRRGKD
jgi:uncharacterized protein